jgi:hypothetical protein
MKSYSYELNSGYFVSLETFTLHLRHMSHDGHQWGAVPIPGIFQSSDQEPRSYALLGYSNPGAPGFLNALFFILPFVALGGNAGSQPELVVSFSSLSTKPLTRGLYIDGGVMMYDPVEDWERVWYSILHDAVFNYSWMERRTQTSLTGTIERSPKRFQLSTGDTSGKEKRDPTECDCRALGSTAAMT